MTALYQRKNLEAVYSTSSDRKEAGRATRQNMSSLKSLAGVKEPKVNPVYKALSTIYCLLFRTRFTSNETVESKKEKRISYNTSGSILFD